MNDATPSTDTLAAVAAEMQRAAVLHGDNYMADITHRQDHHGLLLAAFELGQRVSYGDKTFARICPTCSSFVKADETFHFKHNDFTDEDRFDEPNATCKTHGRVIMPFIGYFGEGE